MFVNGGELLWPYLAKVSIHCPDMYLSSLLFLLPANTISTRYSLPMYCKYRLSIGLTTSRPCFAFSVNPFVNYSTHIHSLCSCHPCCQVVPGHTGARFSLQSHL